MIDQLKEQIKLVAGARGFAVKAKLEVNESRIGWEAQNARIIDIADRAVEFTQEEEVKLRELTLQVYAETGSKAPAEGVGIREVTKLEYALKEAYDWALDHKIALSLDKKSFERMAKEFNTPLDFVTITTEPQATIATHLEID